MVDLISWLHIRYEEMPEGFAREHIKVITDDFKEQLRYIKDCENFVAFADELLNSLKLTVVTTERQGFDPSGVNEIIGMVEQIITSNIANLN